LLSSTFFNELVRSHWLSFYFHKSRQIHIFCNSTECVEILQLVENTDGLCADKIRYTSQHILVTIREVAE